MQVNIVKEAVNKSQNKEQALLLQRIESALRERNLIKNVNLEESICAPVLSRPPSKRDTKITGFESQFFLTSRNRSSLYTDKRQQTTYPRRGIMESED